MLSVKGKYRQRKPPKLEGMYAMIIDNESGPRDQVRVVRLGLGMEEAI
jgi:hypothetical protein